MLWFRVIKGVGLRSEEGVGSEEQFVKAGGCLRSRGLEMWGWVPEVGVEGQGVRWGMKLVEWWLTVVRLSLESPLEA